MVTGSQRKQGDLKTQDAASLAVKRTSEFKLWYTLATGVKSLASIDRTKIGQQ